MNDDSSAVKVGRTAVSERGGVVWWCARRKAEVKKKFVRAMEPKDGNAFADVAIAGLGQVYSVVISCVERVSVSFGRCC